MYTGLLSDGFTIILVLLHTHSVILSSCGNNEGSILTLDQEYLEHGFCLASQETHGFSTHVLCFIIDTLYSIGALLFLTKYPKADAVNPGKNDMMQTVPLTFVHGFLHLLGYIYPQDDPQLSFVVDDGILVFSFTAIATFLFLYSIAHMAHSSKLLALISASITAIIVNCLVPKKLAFVAINAFLYCTMSLSGILRKKSAWYDAAAFFGRLLPTLGTLIESICCADFVHYGGHALLFDGNIALGQTILLWAGFYLHYEKESKKVK